MKYLTSSNADRIAQALDDVMQVLAAIVPTLTPEATAAIGMIEVGDDVANALIPALAPPAPAPASNAKPAVVVEPPAPSQPQTLASRIAALAS